MRNFKNQTETFPEDVSHLQMHASTELEEEDMPEQSEGQKRWKLWSF